MANLRKKVETNPSMPRHLMTEVGVGYRFLR
jgi:two-component system KDP operon response regulator KdpE